MCMHLLLQEIVTLLDFCMSTTHSHRRRRHRCRCCSLWPRANVCAKHKQKKTNEERQKKKQAATKKCRSRAHCSRIITIVYTEIVGFLFSSFKLIPFFLMLVAISFVRFFFCTSTQMNFA